jgi:Na+-driven multidrug efflux pump
MKIPFGLTVPSEDRDETIEYAWEYLPLFMASCIFAIEFEAFKAYLLACEIFTPFIFIHFTTTGLHIFWCWLFISKSDMGINGAGLAILVTEVLKYE